MEPESHHPGCTGLPALTWCQKECQAHGQDDQPNTPDIPPVDNQQGGKHLISAEKIYDIIMISKAQC